MSRESYTSATKSSSGQSWTLMRATAQITLSLPLECAWSAPWIKQRKQRGRESFLVTQDDELTSNLNF